MTFLINLVNGVSLGSIYALIALGYTMVYGIAKMLNFAHGDIIMVGAYAVIAAMAAFGSPVLAIVASVVICVLLGVTIEKVAYKPLRQASPLSVLITAIGVSYLLQSLALLIYGSNKRTFPKVLDLSGFTIRFGNNLQISGNTVVTLAVSTVIMVAVTWLIRRTKTGRAMLAVAEDRGAAQLMGVNVNKTITITFAIGSALASVAGLFYGLTYIYIDPYTGAMPGIKAFVAAVFGGIGSIPGAMLGGILIGVLETLTQSYISTRLVDAVVFAILILVLLVKPTGLLGKKIHEKV